MPQLVALANDPTPLTMQVTADGQPFTVRPLHRSDAAPLQTFLSTLSEPSRRYWHGDTDPSEAARDWIDSIARYDKLRLVAHAPTTPTVLAGVIDLSFSLPDGWEITRYAAAGILLDPARTVRWGPCVADAWQSRGLAAALLPPSWSAAKLLNRDCVVLFGGVDATNHRARRFYTKHGFTEATNDGTLIDMILYLS
ncbi:GNAT family N-acetyltransferase [Dactylosporangium sp. NPDC051541]|uniref:GNAT family N-acetyltransferase n=1 Tax=Dactylosporangium sp. NPDC051541 TaxID=3363977 RepID=UPI0037B51CE0